MPYSNSVQITFPSSGFTSNKPSFDENGEYSDRMKFSTITKVLDLGNTNYGYTEFQVSYSGTVDYVIVNFHQGNERNVSINTQLTDLFLEAQEVSGVVKDEKSGSTTTYYVFVNIDPNNVSQFLNIDVAVGKKDTVPSNVGVKLEYNCTTTVNSYTTGLHVYSPYDARAGSSVLTTKLYSLTPINSWTTNTIVFATPSFSSPALPYYYGYGTNVYKIGGEFDRSYGIKKTFTVSKKLFGKPQVKENTLGPDYFYNSTNLTSEACVIPLMSGVGLVKKILPNSGLSQPQSYRYYMGFDSTTIKKSNDSVFTTYSFVRKKHDPVVGSTHALKKVVQGVVTGYSKVKLDMNLWQILSSAAGMALGAQLLYKEFKRVLVRKLGPIVYDFLKLIWQACLKGFGKTVTQIGLSQVILKSILNAVLGVVGWVLLAYSIYKLLTKVIKINIEEPCKVFLHKFTSTPYINTSNVIYNSSALTGVTNGYYCDGVYYYTQSSNSVTKKELSYTNEIIEDDPAVYQFRYSIQADNPTLVTDWSKLLVLPYTSGKPTPYCGGGTVYNNTLQSTGFTATCCELETAAPTQTFTIPANLISSCESQTDANNKAKEQLQSAYDNAVEYGGYCNPYTNSDTGTIDTAFTHEIKVETYPTEVTLFYNAKNGPITTGTTMYYDTFGCTKVLNGYYAVSGSSPYRTFYYVTGGTVQSIHTMSSSNSTTTNTGQTIKTNNLDYSSNWFYTSTSYDECYQTTNYYENTKNFNPNTLYTNSSLKKGFAKFNQTNVVILEGNKNQQPEDLQLYNDFINTGYTEASAGWYRPLIDWILDYPFYYYVSKSMTLNIEEYCGYQSNSAVQRGFWIYGKIGSDVTPTINDVELSINIYTTGATGNTLLQSLTTKTNGSLNKTFVNFDNNFVKSGTSVTNIEIISIITPNPYNKVTYSTGTKTLCLANNCDIKLSSSTTGTTNASQDNGYALINYSGGTPNYSLYSDGILNTTSVSAGSILLSNLTKGSHNFKAVDSNGCSAQINYSINGTTTVTPVNTGSTGPYVSDYIVLTCNWGTTHRFDFLTRIISPDVGMNIKYGKIQDTYWTRKNIFSSKYFPYVGKVDAPPMPYFAYLTLYKYGMNDSAYPWYWYDQTNKAGNGAYGYTYSPSHLIFNQTASQISTFSSTWEEQRPFMFFPSITYPDFCSANNGCNRVGYVWCVIDVGQIRKFYPSATLIKIDCKGRWYGDYDLKTLNPVSLMATFYKNGNITRKNPSVATLSTSDYKPYPSGDPKWNDTNNYKVIYSPSKQINKKINAYLEGYSYEVIKDDDERKEFLLSGERIATLNLNLSTNEFYFDMNDSTPTL